MALQVSHLRRWFAVAGVALILAVTGLYLHLRRGLTDVLKQVPNKMGVDVEQTAEGFKVSKSEQGRTLFTIQAKKAIQFRESGHAELHDVTITLYGRDSSRYDQIYGDDFEYDPRSGDVVAKGEVRIDLEANPQGILKPDQAVPTNLKNPIHLVTSDLVFNQKTGNAFTKAKVDLRMPQVSGSAVGARYTESENLLRLESQVQFAMTEGGGATVTAARGAISKSPRQVVLEHPHMVHGGQRVQAEQATLFLRDNNTVEQIVATGEVETDIAGNAALHARADAANLEMADERGTLRSGKFTGNVRMEVSGDQPAHANAQRVLLSFVGKNLVSTVRAEGDVTLEQRPPTSSKTANGDAQLVQVNAPAIDFFLHAGRSLERAQTSTGAQIVLLPVVPTGQRTTITAGRFEAKFDAQGRLATVHGAPGAQIVSSNPGQADRSSTSQTLDAAFAPLGGISSIVQQGQVTYSDGERQAWADRAAYTPADQMLLLTGSPRVVDRGMATTARTMRMNRITGDAIADGDVKSTYSDLREQPNGALLASASPIHVTAQSMTAHKTPSLALYTGNVRLWQDANVVQAPSIQFDREHRSVVAQGDGQPVSTVLVQVDKHGNATPVTITAKRLTYTDDQHRAHFDGGVVARGADATITASAMDAYLIPHNQASSGQSVTGETGEGGSSSDASGTSPAGRRGQLDRIVAEGQVVVQQPTRRAVGEKLVYTALDDKFVLTGGSPSIFDAERGKVTGDSLTFYKRDDRVLVEGRETSPTVTTTRVAR